MSTAIVSAVEIRKHFLDLKAFLRITPQELADLLGVARQTVYQYGFQPEKRGARVIPAASIDIMREAALQKLFDQAERTYPPFLDKERALWTVSDIQTTSRARAVYLAGTTGVDPVPHAENKDPELNEAERLSIRWLRGIRGLSFDDQMRASGLGEYDFGRVGRLGLNWGIAPKIEWIEDLKEITYA
jgi:hypothetical protein